MNQIDYYSILQVAPGATSAEIRAAFKRLALLAHPDRSRDPRATRRMQLINEAYQVLGDRERRARYDQERAAQAAPVSIQRTAPEDAQTYPERKRRRAPARDLNSWLRRQLKIIAGFILLTSLLFGWSLFTGQLNPVVILVLVMQVLYIIASMILKIATG